MILIEPLESRIAPATLVSANTVTWTDVDGDLATLHLSKDILTSSNVYSIFQFNTGSVSGSNSTQQQLEVLDLTSLGSLARHVNITVTADTRPGGNGEVDIGLILAAKPDSSTFQFSDGIDLGTVKIQGDLGAIYAGDNYADRGLQKLQVDSLGALNSTLQAELSDSTSTLYNDLNGASQGSPSLESLVLASVGSIDISGNLDGTYGAGIRVLGGIFGNIGSVHIGGSLIGGSTDDSGQIFFMHSIGSVTIDGNIVGGDGTDSGTIEGYASSSTSAGKITVGGSIEGGGGSESGSIYLGEGHVNGISVGGDLIGGTNSDSGEIRAISLGAVSIGGSVVGNASVSASSNGYIYGKASSVSIGGDITGGLGDSSGELNLNGALSSVTIVGSIVGGSNSNAGTLFISGSVKTLTIDGYLQGSSGDHSGYVNISGSVGTVLVGKNSTNGDSILGGSGSNSGQLYVGGNLTSLTLAGSIEGGSKSDSGRVQVVKNLTTLTINGSITGGTGSSSGVLSVGGSLKTLTLNGSLVGGSVSDSGQILVVGTLGTSTIQGNITGGSTANATTSVDESGYLQAGVITNLTIGGNITAGSITLQDKVTTTATLTNSGAIRATTEITELTIDGNVTGTTDCAVAISATGHTTGNVKTDIGIGQLTIGTATGGGNITYANILAGYAPTASSVYGTAKDADASIGSVTINGNMEGTNIVAGAALGGASYFGVSGNTSISGTDRINLTATIASVIVKGQVNSTPVSGDTYGIVSQYLKAIQIGGTNISLDNIKSDDHGTIGTTDTNYLEV